jgi:plasmid maintenance system antidote protein VapI
MMKLEKWLKSNGLTNSQFAKTVGVPHSTIDRLVAGSRSGTHAVTEKIIRGTNGEVLPNDFFDLDKILRAQ